MGKKVTLAEGRTGRVFGDVKKIRTVAPNGDYHLWIPKEELQVTDLYATKNGVYVPPNGVYSRADVDVKPSANMSASVTTRVIDESYFDGDFPYFVELFSDNWIYDVSDKPYSTLYPGNYHMRKQSTIIFQSKYPIYAEKMMFRHPFPITGWHEQTDLGYVICGSIDGFQMAYDNEEHPNEFDPFGYLTKIVAYGQGTEMDSDIENTCRISGVLIENIHSLEDSIKYPDFAGGAFFKNVKPTRHNQSGGPAYFIVNSDNLPDADITLTGMASGLYVRYMKGYDTMWGDTWEKPEPFWRFKSMLGTGDSEFGHIREHLLADGVDGYLDQYYPVGYYQRTQYYGYSHYRIENQGKAFASENAWREWCDTHHID